MIPLPSRYYVASQCRSAYMYLSAAQHVRVLPRDHFSENGAPTTYARAGGRCARSTPSPPHVVPVRWRGGATYPSGPLRRQRRVATGVGRPAAKPTQASGPAGQRRRIAAQVARAVCARPPCGGLPRPHRAGYIPVHAPTCRTTASGVPVRRIRLSGHSTTLSYYITLHAQMFSVAQNIRVSFLPQYQNAQECPVFGHL